MRGAGLTPEGLREGACGGDSHVLCLDYGGGLTVNICPNRQTRHCKGQMLNVTRILINLIKTHTRARTRYHTPARRLKRQGRTVPSTAEDMEPCELSHTAGRSAKCCFAGFFLKRET